MGGKEQLLQFPPTGLLKIKMTLNCRMISCTMTKRTCSFSVFCGGLSLREWVFINYLLNSFTFRVVARDINLFNAVFFFMYCTTRSSCRCCSTLSSLFFFFNIKSPFLKKKKKKKKKS